MPHDAVEAAGLDRGAGKPQLPSSSTSPFVLIDCDAGDPHIIKNGTEPIESRVEDAVGQLPVQEALALELCCGSARLAEALQTAGMQVVGVDHTYNRHAPAVTTINIDLSDTAQHESIWAWLEHPHLRFVAMSPPCGTATRAREKPGGPRPLRSEVHPEGIPSLTPHERKRVDKANIIYLLMVDVAMFCLRRGVLFVIENPSRSLMWELHIMQDLFTRTGVFDVLYDACMHGGRRLKAQRLRTNATSLRSLAVRCDGAHTHEPWATFIKGMKLFHTAEEAAFPYLFCQRMATCIVQELSLKSAPSCEHLALKFKLAEARRNNLAVAGRQHRKSPQLVREFASISHYDFDDHLNGYILEWMRTGAMPLPLTPTFAPGSLLLNVYPKEWGEADAHEQRFVARGGNSEHSGCYLRVASLLDSGVACRVVVARSWCHAGLPP